MAFHCSSEELQRRVIAAKRGGRRRWVVYRRRLDPLSTAKFERFAAEISCRLSHEESREPQHKHILSGEGPNCNAVEKPYSCDLLAIELIRGVIAWRARFCPLPIIRFRQPLSRVIDGDMGLPTPLPGSAGGAFRIWTKCAGGLRFGSQASARHLAAEA